MNIAFEHDYQQKLMRQSFPEPVTLGSVADVQAWRAAWMRELGSWHSPYKLLVDCGNLTVTNVVETGPALQLMRRFFDGFFLRKAVGFGLQPGFGHENLPFPVHVGLEEAATDLGIRAPRRAEATDLRAAIQLQNHFNQHVVELSFAVPVTLGSAGDVQVLRSKLQNNLMQWHSKWSLIVDCGNLRLAPEARLDFERLLKVMRGFFMKDIIGYGRRGADDLPFKVYMARHKAAAVLEAEGAFSGAEVQCQSKK